MAPEAAIGRTINAATDVFGLGRTLQHYFLGDLFLKKEGRVTKNDFKKRGYSQQTIDALFKAMEDDPKKRYRTPKDFIAALNKPESVDKVVKSSKKSNPKVKGSSFSIILGIVLAASVTIGVSDYVIRSSYEKEQPAAITQEVTIEKTAVGEASDLVEHARWTGDLESGLAEFKIKDAIYYSNGGFSLEGYFSNPRGGPTGVEVSFEHNIESNLDHLEAVFDKGEYWEHGFSIDDYNSDGEVDSFLNYSKRGNRKGTISCDKTNINMQCSLKEFEEYDHLLKKYKKDFVDYKTHVEKGKEKAREHVLKESRKLKI